MVTVMMWQPIASAWKMLSSSRGLAQISSTFGYGRSSSTAAAMSGTGSRPVSAMRPAKTETQAGAPPASAAPTSRTWSSVSIAVTFTLTPARGERADQRRTDGSPRVLVTGILT